MNCMTGYTTSLVNLFLFKLTNCLFANFKFSKVKLINFYLVKSKFAK